MDEAKTRPCWCDCCPHIPAAEPLAVGVVATFYGDRLESERCECGGAIHEARRNGVNGTACAGECGKFTPPSLPSEEEADRILRSAGADPAEVGKRGAMFIARLESLRNVIQAIDGLTDLVAEFPNDWPARADEYIGQVLNPALGKFAASRGFSMRAKFTGLIDHPFMPRNTSPIMCKKCPDGAPPWMHVQNPGTEPGTPT